MKGTIGNSLLDQLRNSSERQKLCQMYIKTKKQEFTQSKNKENSMPFNYEVGSNASSEVPFNQRIDDALLSIRTQSPNYPAEQIVYSAPKVVQTQRKMSARRESETLKKGINLKSCVEVLNKIQKSINRSNKPKKKARNKILHYFETAPSMTPTQPTEYLKF